METIFKQVTAALLVLQPFSSNAYGQPHVRLTLKSGEMLTFMVSEKPKMEYHGKIATFSSENMTVEYAMRDIRNVTFSDELVDGIAHQKMEAGKVRSRNGQVIFTGFQDGAEVEVFDVSGKMVESGRIPESGSLSIDTSTYPKGVYIFKSRQITYKWMKI